jgi:hypothetical protein
MKGKLRLTDNLILSEWIKINPWEYCRYYDETYSDRDRIVIYWNIFNYNQPKIYAFGMIGKELASNIFFYFKKNNWKNVSECQDDIDNYLLRYFKLRLFL